MMIVLCMRSMGLLIEAAIFWLKQAPSINEGDLNGRF